MILLSLMDGRRVIATVNTTGWCSMLASKHEQRRQLLMRLVHKCLVEVCAVHEHSLTIAEYLEAQKFLAEQHAIRLVAVPLSHPDILLFLLSPAQNAWLCCTPSASNPFFFGCRHVQKDGRFAMHSGPQKKHNFATKFYHNCPFLFFCYFYQKLGLVHSI